MTGHQINSLVGDLVAMAQAMERLPQVEAELADARHVLSEMDKQIESVRSDLEQSRSYAASLEAKVHNAEVARDDAELRFLELDEKTSKVLVKFNHIIIEAKAGEVLLNPPPKPQPEPQPEPMVETGPVTEAEVGSAPSLETVQRADHVQTAQGQSESDPISHSSPVDDAPSQSPVETSGHTAIGSNPSGPYSGRRYIDYPGWVSREDWLAGGGTNENYDWRESQLDPGSVARY